MKKFCIPLLAQYKKYAKIKDMIKLRAPSLVVSDLRSEAKGS